MIILIVKSFGCFWFNGGGGGGGGPRECLRQDGKHPYLHFTRHNKQHGGGGARTMAGAEMPPICDAICCYFVIQLYCDENNSRDVCPISLVGVYVL